MWRFVVALLVFTLVGSIGLGKLFDVLHARSVQNHGETQHQSLAAQAQLAQVALQSLPPHQQAPLLEQWQLDLPNLEFAIQTLADYPLPTPLLTQLQTQPVLVLETQHHLQAYALLPAGQVLLVSHLKGPVNESTNLLMTICFYAALMLMLLLFLAPFLIRLRRLSLATSLLGKGDLSERVAVGSVWYLKTLETDFNAMAARIETLVGDIKLLASGLSHELRTPLARVRMGLDTLMETNDSDLRVQYETRVNADLDTMEDLVSQLLSFARLQYTLENTQKTPTDVNKIVQAIADQLASPRLSIQCAADNATTLADKHYLSMCINNLVSNALTYSSQHVLLDVACEEDKIIVTVADDGPGIDPKERHNIFKPFVRLNQQTHKGYGIGLAFVARITQWLSANIAINRSDTLGGAEFKLTLDKHK